MNKYLNFWKEPNLKGRLGDAFFAGVLILGPIYLTVVVVRFGVNVLSGPLQPLVVRVMGWLPSFLVEGVATLFSLVLTFAIIIGFGMVGQKVLGKRAISWFETLMTKFPVIGSLYSTIKEFFAAFSSKDKYKSVVFIKMFHDNYRSLGFVTHESMGSDGKKHYRIFVPTIPNPTTGYLLFTTDDGVEFSDMTVDKALRIMLSGGVLELEAKVKNPAPPPT